MPIRAAVLGLATFLVIAICLTSLQKESYLSQLPKCPPPPPQPSPPPETNPEDALSTLFSAIKHPFTRSKYVDANGNEFKIVHDMIWKQPLGHRLLIVDVDTRQPSQANDIFGSRKINWEKMQSKADDGTVSASALNHFTYARIHDYSYVYYQAETISGHHESWVRPHVLKEMLQSYDFVVMMNTDATIQHLEVPLEWLFNRWGVTRDTAIAMPVDAQKVVRGDASASLDSRGKIALNTGFIIAQRSTHTTAMLNAWTTCTAPGSPYPECSKWKQASTYEQRAFSEYIRYDFNPTGKEILEIPCDDAMGHPGLKKNNRHVLSDCNGQFVRQHGAEEGLTKGSAGDAVLQSLAQVLQATLSERKWEYYVDEATDSRPLAGDLRAG